MQMSAINIANLWQQANKSKINIAINHNLKVSNCLKNYPTFWKMNMKYAKRIKKIKVC